MPRNLAFDPDEKLHQAMLVFWEKGYAATSLKDLVDALSINRFSIYNTFGDKQALFQLVLEYYDRHVFKKTLCLLQPASKGMQCIERYLDYIAQALAEDRVGEFGCLIQNTALEGYTLSDPVYEYLKKLIDRWQKALCEVLVQARRQGQINADLDIDDAALFIIAHVQGMTVIRRTLGVESQQRCCSFFRKEIGGWYRQ